MHAEVETMKQGLSGHLRLAVVPTALPIVSRLMQSFWTMHAGVKLTISSHSSTEVLSLLDNVEADVGITYLDDEPIGHVTELPLYRERYHLVTAADGPFADRQSVTWEEAATIPLCLLSPDLQNRRILDRNFAEVGVRVTPVLETNSLVVLLTHIRMGIGSTVMPRIIAEPLGLPATVRVIPLVAPEKTTLIGMVTSVRDPQPPLTAALIAEVRKTAPALNESA
jgi:DNA-binding transcriptional LysR family regulator